MLHISQKKKHLKYHEVKENGREGRAYIPQHLNLSGYGLSVAKT